MSINISVKNSTDQAILYIILLFFCCPAPAVLEIAGKPPLLSCIVSALPIPVFVVVNKPDDDLFHLLSVQWQAQQSPNCFSLLTLQFLRPLCINICLHQWLYCTDREGGRVCPHHCMCYCFLLFWDFGQRSVPPLSLAPPILLLMCCPLSPCIILSYFSPPLSPAALCIVIVPFSLCTLSLSLSSLIASILLFSSLQQSPLVSSLCVSSSPDHLSLLSNTYCVLTSVISPSWGLSTGWSWWAPPVSASWARARKVLQRKEGRNRRGQEPTPPGTGMPTNICVHNVMLKCVWSSNINPSSRLVLQHPQRCHSSLPEEGFGR